MKLQDSVHAEGNSSTASRRTNASRFLLPGSVLHVGTATGRFVTYLSKLGFRYSELEISDSLVETTKLRIAHESAEADGVQADGENPPFRASSF
jgi:protein-L-isoaspartate O-methyltransferase